MTVIAVDEAPARTGAACEPFPIGEPTDEAAWAAALGEKARVQLRLPRNPVRASITVDASGKASFSMDGSNSGLEALRALLVGRLSRAVMPPFARGVEISGFGGYLARGDARVSAFVAHDVARTDDPDDADTVVGERLLDLACVLPIVCTNAGLAIGERICSADDVEGNRPQMREAKVGSSSDAVYILADVRARRGTPGAFLRRSGAVGQNDGTPQAK